MAGDPWAQLMELFQGTWFNELDPYYGYLHIKPFKNEDEGGEAVALIHAKHGKTDPPIWYQGVWKATDFGFEVVAGPYHWKQIAMFGTPVTREVSFPRLYFESFMNGWGQCNMGKLGATEELDWVEKMKDLFPTWQDYPPQERTFWKDYPSATWCESQKFMKPSHTFDDAGTAKLNPKVPPEDQVTHNGGQPVAPQVAIPNPAPPPIQPPGVGPPMPPPPEPPKPPEGGGGAAPPPPPPTPGGPSAPSGNAGAPPAPAAPATEAAPAKPSESAAPADPPAPPAPPAEAPKAAEPPQSEEDKDKGKGWLSRAVDRATDVVDTITDGATKEISEAIDDAVDQTSKAVGSAVDAATDAVLGKEEEQPPPAPASEPAPEQPAPEQPKPAGPPPPPPPPSPSGKGAPPPPSKAKKK
jgi:hypothetical protein